MKHSDWIKYLHVNYLSKECSRHFLLDGASNSGKSMFQLGSCLYLNHIRGIKTDKDKLRKHMVFSGEEFDNAWQYAIDNYGFLMLFEIGQYLNARDWKNNTGRVKKFELDRLFGLLIFADLPNKDNADIYLKERTSFTNIKMKGMWGTKTLIKPFGIIRPMIVSLDWVLWFKSIERPIKLAYLMALEQQK